MAYEYVKRFYGVNPVAGHKARHTETGEIVTIMREHPSHAHYVRIKMAGGLVGFSHPTALDYDPKEPQHG